MKISAAWAATKGRILVASGVLSRIRNRCCEHAVAFSGRRTPRRNSCASSGGGVTGVLNGFDRFVFRGTLRSLSHEGGVVGFPLRRGVRFVDFGRFVEAETKKLLEASLAEARARERPVRYLASSRSSEGGNRAADRRGRRDRAGPDRRPEVRGAVLEFRVASRRREEEGAHRAAPAQMPVSLPLLDGRRLGLHERADSDVAAPLTTKPSAPRRATTGASTRASGPATHCFPRPARSRRSTPNFCAARSARSGPNNSCATCARASTAPKLRATRKTADAEDASRATYASCPPTA